ncbi:MAG TPA: lysozyme inhibitor LprI family protein [Terriglobales bacterium]|jgi:uncharacterized protein YecT (DUF1311 family)|nr:lysozyme inhibitor LprI family protein [Terriglobales bacterium]
MNKWLLGLVLAVAPIVAHAQTTPDCAAAKTQTEMNACAGTSFQTADKELNRTYQAVLKRYAEDASFIAKLRASQRAWLRVREAELDAIFPHSADANYYGTIYPQCRAGKLTKMVTERTRELREWLDGVEEGEICAGSIKTKAALSEAGKL